MSKSRAERKRLWRRNIAKIHELETHNSQLHEVLILTEGYEKINMIHVLMAMRAEASATEQRMTELLDTLQVLLARDRTCWCRGNELSRLQHLKQALWYSPPLRGPTIRIQVK